MKKYGRKLCPILMVLPLISKHAFCVQINIFTISEAGGQHFSTLLWNKVSWTAGEGWTITAGRCRLHMWKSCCDRCCTEGRYWDALY